MVKYKLRLKDSTIGFDCVVVKRAPSRTENNEVWLHKDEFGEFGYLCSETHVHHFSQDEINNLPYGLVKLHHIIEVKEELYHIKLKGYCEEERSYINVYNNDFSEWELDTKTEHPITGYRTSFTLKEIKDNLPEYEKLKVNVGSYERVSF